MTYGYVWRPIKRSFSDVEHFSCTKIQPVTQSLKKTSKNRVWYNTSQIFGGVNVSKSRIRFYILRPSKRYIQLFAIISGI